MMEVIMVIKDDFKMCSDKNKYKCIDLFCGAGGLSLGFEMENFNILAGFEIEPKFLETYTNSHPNTIGFNEDLNETNVLKLLKENDINPNSIDVVIGGPPCQGFSTVGNRMIDDPRNNLVRIYANIVEDIKPKMFLMENVSGLASMKNGKDELIKDELIDIFNEIGYNVKSKVLLAADYGVPQLRKRIFFVGIRKEHDYNFKFPTPTHHDKNSLLVYSDDIKQYLTVKDALSDLPMIECKESSIEYDLPPQNDYQEYCRRNSDKLFNHKAPNHSELVIERIKNIHLGQQKGWYIISGQRRDKECEEYNVKPGEYALISVEKHYPNFTNLKRTDNLSGDEWEFLKKQYNYRCATCGSVEGEPNIHYPNITTQLQKGHKDPNKSLELGNIIPQCDQCNRQDRNNFVYNDKGRVIKIANPQFVLRSDKKIKKTIYDLLKKDYGDE